MYPGHGWSFFFAGDADDQRPDIDRETIKRVWGYSRPYAWQLGGVLVTVLVTSVLAVIPPLLIKRLVDVAIPAKDLGMVTLLGLGMLGIPLISTFIGVAQRWWSSRVGEGIIFDLRCQLYDHLQRMSLRFFTATRTGELVSRVQSDVIGAQTAITGTFVSIISNFVQAVVILVVMFKADWRLTLLSLIALPLFILPARRVGRVLKRVTQEQMEHNAAMSAITQETFNVSGALLVKLFGRTKYESDRFAAEAGAVRDLGIRRAMVGRWFFSGLSLVGAVGTALVFWLGGSLVVQGELTLGTVVMFSTLIAQLYGPLAGLSNSRVELATSLVSFERVFEVIDLPPDIVEGEVDLPVMDGTIEFDDVSFRYSSGEMEGLSSVKRFGRRHHFDEDGPVQVPIGRALALDDVSFRVGAGNLAALVGPSGAGKTTISYLIPRMYDVTDGAVKLDGHDVRTLTFDSIAGAIGVVTQETFLFHDTIANNLKYARSDATKEQLENAARAANIHDFIVSLPQGYETVVGERGYRLSGGERQRIAIARALLKDPRILILDEATSHLDSRSEALIQQALERLLEGRTSVVIAHRLSTILAADQILVFDQGHLVESGRHSELVGQGGLYTTLYETQFKVEADTRLGA
jgi:ATP-binding cassette subfamily B protein